MWKLKLWVPPVRHRVTGKMLKPGHWIDGGTQPSDEACESELRRLSGLGKTARAKAVESSAYSGMCATKAYFARWTGSGGRHP